MTIALGGGFILILMLIFMLMLIEVLIEIFGGGDELLQDLVVWASGYLGWRLCGR